ncbi:hypothetical protein IQ241_23020 [Romeria aff. gracilis LEGE 07310]|uniref:High light inducible protein n=1 Tax=Vasconcelosia minhoensis LEGE 07310 TaxID=915328 RepID=A0A8J7AJJ1_9CYAN|nr:chlorophyll a/b-binding protein [Romeria gracilis]MBE9080129.1 hypothetical protein [Romeria aff. gracilis LEGE 07310]
MENLTEQDLSPSSEAPDKTLGISVSDYYRPKPQLGFTPYAELWNGRLAMVGFVVALVAEILSSHGWLNF